MRSLRCRLDAPPPGGEAVATLSPDESSHLARVLRAREGQEVEAFDGAGHCWRARVVAPDPRATTLELLGLLRHEPSPPPRPGLALALAKPDAFEAALEHAVELGAGVLVPLQAGHCVVRLDDKKAAAKLERWQKIAREALKQCERLHDLRVLEPLSPAAAIQAAASLGLAPVALVERDAAPPLLDILDALPAPPLFLVGPEGGWTPAERQAFAPIARASLGHAILRAETAALAALATALAHAATKRDPPDPNRVH